MDHDDNHHHHGHYPHKVDVGDMSVHMQQLGLGDRELPHFVELNDLACDRVSFSWQSASHKGHIWNMMIIKFPTRGGGPRTIRGKGRGWGEG